MIRKNTADLNKVDDFYYNYFNYRIIYYRIIYLLTIKKNIFVNFNIINILHKCILKLICSLEDLNVTP